MIYVTPVRVCARVALNTMYGPTFDLLLWDVNHVCVLYILQERSVNFLIISIVNGVVNVALVPLNEAPSSN